MFDIAFDAAAATLRLRLTGFWTAAVMDRFAGELLAWTRRLARDGSCVILSDCRDYPVQSAEVSAGWARLLGRDSQVVQPYAVVVGSMLNKMQAERALAAPGLRVFTDMAEAQRWLNGRQRGAAGATGQLDAPARRT